MTSLLAQFFDEELNESLKEGLLEAFKGKEGIKEFTGNRFNLTVNLDSRFVTIEDDLDVTENGKVNLSIDEFLGGMK